MSIAQRYQNYSIHREKDFEEPLLVRAEETSLLVEAMPRPLVLVNGAWDLLHTGHMRLLFAARRKAATLVVGVDSDELVRRQKGHSRPVMSFTERCSALSYMPVDMLVEITSRKDMDLLVRSLKPDLRVQSSEYRNQPSRYPQIPKLFVRNGRVHTSSIISRIERNLL